MKIESCDLLGRRDGMSVPESVTDRIATAIAIAYSDRALREIAEGMTSIKYHDRDTGRFFIVTVEGAA